MRRNQKSLLSIAVDLPVLETLKTAFSGDGRQFLFQAGNIQWCMGKRLEARLQRLRGFAVCAFGLH